ncbi:MAG: carboxypeptidase regulatory-like domain-containing protein [Deltaproteobacteria bacterium]|nr:carboxypeptidase regulatory-like domain-containing protein [Deltaproteobacteria bacterium]
MRAWSALALLAVAGCSFDSPEVQTIENSCANDVNCPTGVCDGNICIDDSGASVDVAIEILSDSSNVQLATPASWAIGPESFSGASTRDIVLPATREVRGVVRWDGVRVPATLRFVRRMSGDVAPLTPVAVEVDTLREASEGDGSEGYDFSTVLVAGEIYDVIVLPSSDMVMPPAQAAAPAVRSLPPLYLELRVDDGALTAPFRFDVAFPVTLTRDCTANIHTGCTLTVEVLSVADQAELPEIGLQVRAVDKNTARVVSSIGETDEFGRVAIRISDTASDYWIRVTSSTGREPFPSVSVDPNVALAGDPKRIYIPRLDPVQFTGRVRDAHDTPVPGATVRFLSIGIFDGSQLGLEGSFTASATSSEDGSFGVELLPGFYSISVAPPEDVENTWGIFSGGALVDEGFTEGEAFVVPSQISLRGEVVTFRDESASGVTILASARPSEDLGIMHRSQEAVSNEMGGFAMSVDPGLYDVHVKMSSETGFAWLVEPELVMSAEVGTLARGYQLDPPIPVRGVIRTSDGEPVPNALIRAYVLARTEGAASRPVQVAESVSGEDGSYRLLIAPRLGDE